MPSGSWKYTERMKTPGWSSALMPHSLSSWLATWVQKAPLGWDLSDQEPAARAVLALLSDWFPATTGEIVHVDGGFHAVGV